MRGVFDVTIDQAQEPPPPEEQKDIYRGDPPSPPISRPPSSVTSSSSAGRSVLGLRRGSLGAILDMAINRWARASSDSSSVASSSTFARNRMPRRRTRPSSVATSHNTHTENIIFARRKAWQQGRVLPREFVLFLPATLAIHAADNLDHSTQERRVFRSSTLPLVLSQLDSAIHRSAKQRKKQPKVMLPGGALEKRNIDDIPSQPSFHAFQARMRSNGKNKTSLDTQIYNDDRAVAEKSPRRPAWWLDVSSPTWSDMREIGKLLHLHPLALEDILQQEPREKFEVFPRLGYYFIVFRALDSERTRTKARTQLDLTMKGDKTGVLFTDCEIGATNVYIVVFREGICTFHFEDISDHVSRVRNRIMQLEDTFHPSSDWIAYGILDSIVDQFFPLLNLIEREIKALDDVVLSINGPLRNRRQLKESISNPEPVKGLNEKEEEKFNAEIIEKTASFNSDEARMWFLRCAGPFSRGASFVRRFVATPRVWKFKQSNLSRRKEVTPSPPPLLRMASKRRVVTSLTRLLNTKSDVVSQIRKRLASNGLVGLDVHFSEQDLTGEVVVYLGDIQDHILSLQQSLAHYERMLSHLHPAYISHIRVSLAQAKAGMDHILFRASVFTVAVLAMQIVIGVFSMNVGNLPRNNRSAHPPAPFNYFIGLIVFLLLLSGGVVLLARYWWRQAKRKFARARQSKNRSWVNMF